MPIITKYLVYLPNYLCFSHCILSIFRESTPEGSPLSQILETGLNRPRFSADCLNVFLKELKINLQQGWNKHPVMLMIDGINVLFQERTLVSKTIPRRKNHGTVTPYYLQEACTPDELSMLVAIKHMLKSDYKNSCVMGSVDKMLTLKMDKRPRTPGFRPPPPKYWTVNSDNYKPFIMEPDYPFVLLGDHGWQYMHPFIPIETANYTPGELDVMIDYYTDKRLVFTNLATLEFTPWQLTLQFITFD